MNLGGLKNMLGSFSSPAGCLIDLAFLSSLPERQIKCGLAEVVKIGELKVLRPLAPLLSLPKHVLSVA